MLLDNSCEQGEKQTGRAVFTVIVQKYHHVHELSFHSNIDVMFSFVSVLPASKTCNNCEEMHMSAEVCLHAFYE